MPIFEYQCEKCDAQFEERVSSNQKNKPICLSCGSTKVKKVISRIQKISSPTKSKLPARCQACPNQGCARKARA